jgi:hypothetical protein
MTNALSASSVAFLAALIAPIGRALKLGIEYFLPECSNLYSDTQTKCPECGTSFSLTDKSKRDRALESFKSQRDMSIPDLPKRESGENIQLKNLSREEIIKAANDRTEIFTNPKIVSSASFLVIVFVSLIYTLFAVLLFRYFLKMR